MLPARAQQQRAAQRPTARSQGLACCRSVSSAAPALTQKPAASSASAQAQARGQGRRKLRDLRDDGARPRARVPPLHAATGSRLTRR